MGAWRRAPLFMSSLLRKRRNSTTANVTVESQAFLLGAGTGGRRGGGEEVEEVEGSPLTSFTRGSTPEARRAELEERLQRRHPWREWMAFVELLLRRNYFEKIVGWGSDKTTDFEYESFVKHGVRKFGQDRHDILRFLSRKDISKVVGFGCPSLDKRAVSSCKRLRHWCSIPEGEACGRCRLKRVCDRAFLVPKEHLQTGTWDVMEVLFCFSVNAFPSSSFSLLEPMPKDVEEAVLSILRQAIHYGSRPKALVSNIDLASHSPKPLADDDIEMKEKHLRRRHKWACAKCKFINSIRDHFCRVCKSLRPPMRPNPGDWKCANPMCKSLNRSENFVCFKCKFGRAKPFKGEDLEEDNSLEVRSKHIIENEDIEEHLMRSTYPNERLDDEENDTSYPFGFKFDSHARLWTQHQKQRKIPTRDITKVGKRGDEADERNTDYDKF